MIDTEQAQVRTEGQPAFPVETKENDNSASSPEVEQKQTGSDQTQSQGGEQTQAQTGKDGGGDKGFADHPAWKEREGVWTDRFNQQEKRHVDEIQKLREEFDTKYGQKAPQGGGQAAPTEAPSWFGGDEQQWKDFTAYNQDLLSKSEERILKNVNSRAEQEQKLLDEATKFFQDEAAAIEGDKDLNPKGLRVDRNKLLKTALDNDLVDSKGRWNYRGAWRIMNGLAAQPRADATNERKQIAGATTSESTAETKQPPVRTSVDFQNPMNRPW